MKGAHWCTTIVTLALAGVGAGQLMEATGHMDHEDAKHELMAIEHAFNEAIITNDVPRIKPFMHEQWRLINADGSVTDRQQFLEVVASGTLTHDMMESTDPLIIVVGDSATVTTRTRARGTWAGTPMTTDERVTSMYTRDGDTWSCILTHLTTIPADRESTGDLPYVPEVLLQLAVTDLERSMKFYGETLDLKRVSHEPDLKWAKYDTAVPGFRIGIGEQDVVSPDSTSSINIGVADVKATRTLLESRGVVFPNPDINIPGIVKLADFTDPDGNRLRLAGPPDPD